MNKATSIILCFIFYSNLCFGRIIENDVVNVSDTSVVFIKSIPQKLVISADKISIKKGEVVNLVPSQCDGGTVIWENGTTANSRAVSPTQNTVYSGYCSKRGCNGAVGFVSIQVTESPLYIDVSNASLCQGETAVLKANGCLGNYVWSDNQTGDKITVQPNATIVYKVDCFINGVFSGQSSAVVEVTTIPDAPEVNYQKEILLGDSTMLTAYCNSGIVWDTTNISSKNRFKASLWVRPSVATVYSVHCQNGNCSSTKVNFTVKVKTGGIIIYDKTTGSKDSLKICEGDSINLVVKGCLSNKYVWNPNVSSTNIYKTLATESRLYIVDCVDAVYGNRSDSIYVNVIKKIVLSYKVEKDSEFIGAKIKITASGCDAKNILWFTKSIIDNKKLSYEYIGENPIDTVYFTCLGFCKTDTMKVITSLQLLKPNPIVITKKICEGNSVIVESGCPTNSGVSLWVNGSLFKFDSSLIEFPYLKLSKYEIACFDKKTSKNSAKVGVNILGTGTSFKNLIIFPNPFDEFFKVASDGCLDGITIRLYDVEGRLINRSLSYVNEDGQLKVFGEAIASGNYVIQIIQDNTVYATKVIIKQNLN